MRRSSALAAMAGLLALAACNKHDEEKPVVEDNAAEMNMEEEQPVEAPPVLEPEVPLNNSAVDRPPPPPKVSEDQQTLDDADATGMTSRLPDDYDGSGGGNRSAAGQ